MNTYEPTEEDIQAYNEDQAKIETATSFEIKHTSYGAESSIIAKKHAKNDTWMLIYSGPMALNFRECLGRGTKEQMIQTARTFALKYGWIQ